MVLYVSTATDFDTGVVWRRWTALQGIVFRWWHYHYLSENITTDFLKIYQNNVIWRRKYSQDAKCKHIQSHPVVKHCGFIPGCSRVPLSAWRQNVYKDFRVLPQSLQAKARIVGYIKLDQGRFLSHPFGFIIHRYSCHSTPRCQTPWQTRSIIHDLMWRSTYIASTYLPPQGSPTVSTLNTVTGQPVHHRSVPGLLR